MTLTVERCSYILRFTWLDPSPVFKLHYGDGMSVHLINPSDTSFGIGIIVPRWLYVIACATPARFGTPNIVDETLGPTDYSKIQPGDVVGIGIHTFERAARLRGRTKGARAWCACRLRRLACNALSGRSVSGMAARPRS